MPCCVNPVYRFSAFSIFRVNRITGWQYMDETLKVCYPWRCRDKIAFSFLLYQSFHALIFCLTFPWCDHFHWIRRPFTICYILIWLCNGRCYWHRYNYMIASVQLYNTTQRNMSKPITLNHRGGRRAHNRAKYSKAGCTFKWYEYFM